MVSYLKCKNVGAPCAGITFLSEGMCFVCTVLQARLYTRAKVHDRSLIQDAHEHEHEHVRNPSVVAPCLPDSTDSTYC